MPSAPNSNCFPVVTRIPLEKVGPSTSFELLEFDEMAQSEKGLTGRTQLILSPEGSRESGLDPHSGEWRGIANISAKRFAKTQALFFN